MITRTDWWKDKMISVLAIGAALGAAFGLIAGCVYLFGDAPISFYDRAKAVVDEHPSLSGVLTEQFEADSLSPDGGLSRVDVWGLEYLANECEKELERVERLGFSPESAPSCS